MYRDAGRVGWNFFFVKNNREIKHKIIIIISFRFVLFECNNNEKYTSRFDIILSLILCRSVIYYCIIYVPSSPFNRIISFFLFFLL